ncbi:hypothetical protein AB0H82_11055 [Streptomyces sp. NPDC050732]|uniref:hypothetical protein n=1 Tax=Streptomyces sp. NPDC050732 TaxID=3154632 RepID=UPI0034443BCE
MAITHRGTGRADLAAIQAELALQAARTSGDPASEIDALITGSSVDQLRGNIASAVVLLSNALTIAERHGFRQQHAEVQTWLS